MVAVVVKEKPAIEPNTQEAVLNSLSKIPPTVWLARLTPEQQEHWHRVKKHTMRLHDELKAYFGGQEAAIGDDAYLLLLRDYYLGFYGVIQIGWKAVQETARKKKIELPVQTPGECLIAVLEGDVEAFFAMCLQGYEEWSSRKTYETYKLGLKIDRIRAKPEKNWTKGDRLAMDNYVKATKGSDYLEPSLLIFCLMAAEENKAKVTGLRRKLLEFNRVKAELHYTVANQLSPTKKARSIAWKQGQKLMGNSKGTYS